MIRPQYPRRTSGIVVSTVLALVAGTALAPPAVAQGPTGNQLFPQPFIAEHHIERSGGDGPNFVGETVVDHYGGSWIVSERPDGSRLIIDFDRRQLTEVWTERGSYAVLSFGRMAELQRRLYEADRLPDEVARLEAQESSRSDAEAEVEEPSFVFDEVDSDVVRSGELAAAGTDTGMRHLRVRLADARTVADRAQVVEVWVDTAIRLSRSARRELAAFETEVLAATPSAIVAPSRYVAAAREHADGAFPMRTRRRVAASNTVVEDVVTRLEVQESFPAELVAVPDGFQRTPHPLERIVSFMEDEAEYVARARAAVESGR